MRVISIASDSPEVAGCDEDSGVVRKVTMPLARREFLKGSGVLLGTGAGAVVRAGNQSSVDEEPDLTHPGG